MHQLPEALTALASYSQFILYKLIPSKVSPGKMDKLPVDYRTLQVFVKDDMWQDDPKAWTDATTAINLAKVCGDDYGVGFFFTAKDPFYFIDIDKCANPAGGWSDNANAVMSYFPDAAVEVSQSGTGLHIFGMYTTMPDHGCKNIPLGLEFYTERRFVALTGTNIIGNAGANGDQYLQAFINNYMTPRVTATPEAWTTEALPEWNGPDDEKLIKKALASKSAAGAFGARATFRDLWERNVEVLSTVYAPDASDEGEFDESTADMALAQHLAFWTGKNCEHIERLMWLSKLVRDKWTKHKNYLRNTITRCVSLQPDNNIYKGPPPKVSLEQAAPVQRESVEPGIRAGYQYLAGTQQVEHFKGCVYVQDIHKVFTPRGAFLKPDQFNATYGGYVFAMDDTNRKETKKAWEAFTESQLVEYKQAETTCFRPDLAPGAFTTHDDKIAVNIYVPTNTPRVAGDPTLFLNHLTKVLPNEHDRAILLAYMAACIQHKGVKFQWAPLLQGMEGNGKTLFTRCVAFAIGERFTHMPPAAEIAEKYNDWLYGTLFIGVEDIYVPDHKLNVIEVLKPMITGERQAIRSMGVSQIMRSICCNFMFNSNHKDAVRKTRRDRRFCIFYTQQQNDGDLERDGMGGDYFPNLYKWLKTEDGYAIVANYLETYQIPDALNPATSCHRAPTTSSTDEVIEASLGGIEQEILEAIEQGRPGFAGGWISSTALEVLLENLRATRSMPQNKRKQMLNDMGYHWHPALTNGRVNNYIGIDNGKPKLYIKNNHLSLNLKTCAEISKAYQDAQGGIVATNNAAANAFGHET